MNKYLKNAITMRNGLEATESSELRNSKYTYVILL